MNKGYIPREIRELDGITLTERWVLLGISCLDGGLWGSVTWFAQWLGMNRSQLSRCINALLQKGMLLKRAKSGRVTISLNDSRITTSQNFNAGITHTADMQQVGPIMEPDPVAFSDNNSITKLSIYESSDHRLSVSKPVDCCKSSHLVLQTVTPTVANRHTYIQSKIQSKYTKYITYGSDNFLCIYDEQGKLIDAHYAGKAHDVAQACEAYACIKNKTSYQSQNLEKIPLENKCGELKGCDLACTAPRLLTSVVSSGTEQADSTAKKERDFKDESSSSDSTSNGATELLSLNSSGDIASSEIKLIVTEGGSLGTDSQALRGLSDGQSHNDLTIGNKSSHVTPVEEQQKTQALSGNAFCASSVATQGLLTDANAAKSSGAGEIKSSSKTSSFEPRIKHSDILECLKRVYSLEGAIAEECAQEVEKRFGGERNWRWGYRAMTTDDLFQVCYWPVVNRFGRDYVLAVQKANGIPCKKFKSRKTSGKTYAQAKQPGLNVAKAASAYGNAKPVAQATKRIPRAQRTIFQIMEDAQNAQVKSQAKSRDAAMPQSLGNQQAVTPQFNSEGYLTNVCSLDDLDNWRKSVAA